jgi:Ser/Thr protein kinase RdoA (MazF antagonist)
MVPFRPRTWAAEEPASAGLERDDMTDGKDFKRLVRQRMAKTGESYTTARAQLRPFEAVPPATLEEFGNRYKRHGVERLGPHLEAQYDIRVKRLTDLDGGVVRVDRDRGPSWVARVSPDVRQLSQVEQDAAVLNYLAVHDFPAERCAHAEPVSVLEDQGVLVTELVPGDNARMDMSGQTLFALGDLLGRLHTLPGAENVVERGAGGWHHLSQNGGSRSTDVGLLVPFIDAKREKLDSSDYKDFEFAIEQLMAVDDCVDLPQTLSHPDPCGANAMVGGSGDPVLIDWTGAGRGPRLLGLGALLSGSLHAIPGAAPSRDFRRVDAIVAGYRRHVRLAGAEADRLEAAMLGFGVVLDFWSMLFWTTPVRLTAQSIRERIETCERAAERAVEAFDLDEDELTGWFVEPALEKDPNQGELF